MALKHILIKFRVFSKLKKKPKLRIIGKSMKKKKQFKKKEVKILKLKN